jgi:hypothetical protein
MPAGSQIFSNRFKRLSMVTEGRAETGCGITGPSNVKYIFQLFFSRIPIKIGMSKKGLIPKGLNDLSLARRRPDGHPTPLIR